MPPTFYDWISNLPPTPAWEESQSDVDISSLDFADSPYLTLTSSPPHNKKIKIDKFVMKRVDESGLLHLQVEMSFYASINFPFGLIYSLGSTPLANWDHCNIKPLHFLAIMIEYIFSDTYRISRVLILELLTHSVVLKIQRLFSSAFLAACTIAHRKENLVGMLQFPEEELDEAIMGSKLDFLTAMGNDGVDELMLMMASTFTQDYYDGNPDEEAHALMKPFSFSKSLNSDPGSWMIRTYTPLLLMDCRGCNRESCDQTKVKLLHYALTLNHLQAVIQLRYTVEIFPDWIDVEIHIQNVKCDITPFSFHQYPEREKQLKELGLKNERHFPSHIVLSISPLLDQFNILNFSRTKSCQDPGTIRYQSEQSMGIRNCSWKFYQSEEKANSTGKLGWVLHDNGTGKKIVSMTEPNIDSINLNRFKRSHAWFRHENCSSLTKKVGVAFKDDCGHSFTWRVNRDLEGQTLRWLLSGFISLTYWPVQYDTSYCENICHEFSQHIEFKLVQVPRFSLSLAAPISLATTPLIPIHPITPPLVPSTLVEPTSPTTTHIFSSNVVAGISNNKTPFVSSTMVAPTPLATTSLVSSTSVAPTPPTTNPLASRTVVALVPPATTPLASSTATTTPLLSLTFVEPAHSTTTPLVSSARAALENPVTTPLVPSTLVEQTSPTTTHIISSTSFAPTAPTTAPLACTMATVETPTTTPLFPSTLVESTSPTTTHIISSFLAALIDPALFDTIPNEPTPVVASEQLINSSAQSTSQSPSSPKLTKENSEKRLRQREGARTSRHIASSIGNNAYSLTPRKKARHK